MMGGGIAASAFLEARILTRVHLTIFPVLLGSGIKLFAPIPRPISLTLDEQRKLPNGVLIADYSVAYNSN